MVFSKLLSTLTVFAITLTFSALAVAFQCPIPSSTNPQSPASGSESDLVNCAIKVLDRNWVDDMNSTLPSPNLYPHQWSWDASFISIGYSHYNTHKAIIETDALFRGQWQNGLLPHIVFNPSAIESYFPGPDFWKITTAGANGPINQPTSGIVQPPVHAIASLAIYQNAVSEADKQMAYDHLVDIYPKLVRWHNYLYHERDPRKRGLVFVRHMWESGMDNSPAWEPVLARMHITKDMLPLYKRADQGKTKHDEERPTDYFYDRAVYLIKLFYDNKYDEARIFEETPFAVEDVLFNSILARAGNALARIAFILGKYDEAVQHRKRADWTSGAITEHLYDEQDGFFYNYDLKADEVIRNRISGGFVALYGAKVDDRHLNSALNALVSDDFLGEDLSAWTIPSVSRNDPDYTNTTYWKGPAWLNINYLVRDGLIRNGHKNDKAMKVADYLRDRSLELMRVSPFYEYFHPIEGSGHGGHQFSWSAALTIDWVRSPDVDNHSLPAFVSILGLLQAHPLKVAASVIYAMLCVAGLLVYPHLRKSTETREGSEEQRTTATIESMEPVLEETVKLPHVETPTRPPRNMRRRTRGPMGSGSSRRH